MGGQHVLLAIRIEHKRRIQSEDWLAGDRRTRGRLRAVLAASMDAPRGGSVEQGLADVSIDCFRHQ